MSISNWINGFQPAAGPPPRRLVRFIFWCLHGAGKILLLAAAMSALAGMLEVSTALLMGAVVDGALASGTSYISDHWPFLLAVAGFFLILRPAVFGSSAAMQSQVIQPNIMPLVLSRINRYTLGHSVQFFDNDFAGRIAQKQMQIARGVTDVVVETINTISFAMASLVGSALYLATIDWRVGLALALWLLVYLAMIRWFMPRIRHFAGRRAESRAMLTGQIVDTVTNIKTVKLFAHNRHEDNAAIQSMSAWRDTAIGFGKIATLFRFVLMLVAGLVPVALVGGMLWLWSRGQASAGDIVATGAIAMRIAQMTGWVSFTLMTIYSHLGEIEDGMNTLTPFHDLEDSKDATRLKITNAEIAFRDVSFAYGRREGGVTGINLTIAPGEKLGIVGASGAGKSTLVSLLLRLYDPENGAVMIDGQDLRSVTQESLRREIGMVTQETAMFNRSAFENIRYGRPDATDEQVVEAARRAEAHAFILEMEDHKGRRGYDAYLGERGVKLSGGQRQRIALARAILKDAPILVLDEATSALDSEVEASIQAALTCVMKGKTVLAIAHRLSTIARMDRIIVLEQGQIVESGTHSDLLVKGGIYARYWNRQSGGFLGLEIKGAAE